MTIVAALRIFFLSCVRNNLVWPILGSRLDFACGNDPYKCHWMRALMPMRRQLFRIIDFGADGQMKDLRSSLKRIWRNSIAFLRHHSGRASLGWSVWRNSARFRLTHAASINSQRYIYFIIRTENYSAAESTSCDVDRSVHVCNSVSLHSACFFFFPFFLFLLPKFLWTSSSSLCGCPIVIGDLAFTSPNARTHAIMVRAWVKWTVFVYYVLCIGGHIVCKTPRSKWVPAVALFHSRRLCVLCKHYNHQ